MELIRHVESDKAAYQKGIERLYGTWMGKLHSWKNKPLKVWMMWEFATWQAVMCEVYLWSVSVQFSLFKCRSLKGQFCYTAERPSIGFGRIRNIWSCQSL